jgi:UDP-N-acetylglucosamine 4,6-dehydratase
VIKTNIIGSQNVIEACIDAEVDRLICISSDKAVSPVNLYGYTKACMEKLAILANSYSGETLIGVARYGNVIGSRGSIFTLLSPRDTTVRLTHPDMTRFWLPLRQAAAFVVERMFEMEGGEIFIPKMKSAYLREVVEAVCPAVDITYTGMRPGEKLHEAITNPHEAVIDHPSYYTIDHTKWLPPTSPLTSLSPASLMGGGELVTLFQEDFADAMQST